MGKTAGAQGIIVITYEPAAGFSNIYHGTDQINAIYLGTDPINKVYYGSKLIYEQT